MYMRIDLLPRIIDLLPSLLTRTSNDQSFYHDLDLHSKRQQLSTLIWSQIFNQTLNLRVEHSYFSPCFHCYRQMVAKRHILATKVHHQHFGLEHTKCGCLNSDTLVFPKFY